jgi:peptidoglycan/LPS O-acetylase OafA/YrhL
VTKLSQQRTDLEVGSLDGFRGLALLWIIFGHCRSELGGLVKLDNGPVINVLVTSFTGVDMLFIISGFVLFLPVVVRGTLGDTRSYAIRRAARIVPAFYLALVFSYFAARALGIAHGGVGTWLSHLFFVHAEAHRIEHVGFGTNGAMWTMAVEVMFYFALPIVALAYRRRPFIGLAIAIVATELWHLAVVRLPDLLDAFGWSWVATEQAQMRMALAFPSYLGHFAIGMTAAWLYVRLKDAVVRRDRQQRTALVVQAVAAAGALSVLYLRGLQQLQDRAGPLDHWVKTLDRALLFGLLVLATTLAPRFARWPFENKVTKTLGVTCYGAYLVHQPLILLLIPALGLQPGTTSNGDLLLLLAIAAPVSIAVGFLSFAFVEDPIRRWARRFGRKDETVPADGVALVGAQA